MRSRGSSHRSYWRPAGQAVGIQLVFVSAIGKLCLCRKCPLHLRRASQPLVQANLLLVWPLHSGCFECIFENLGAFTFLRITYLVKFGVHFVIENPTTSLLWRYKCVKVSLLLFLETPKVSNDLYTYKRNLVEHTFP